MSIYALTMIAAGVSMLITGAAVVGAEGFQPVTDHGARITSANSISYVTIKNSSRSGHDLLCWTTTAESGGHFIAMDLTTKKVFIHPLNHLEAYPIVAASDKNVYVGSTSGEVMRWDPKTDQWKALGKPLFSVPGRPLNHVRALCEGPDGWLYAGSCTGERASVNMKTGEVRKLPETPEQGDWYVSSVAPLPDGRIAFGYGHKARIFVFDPREGRDVGQWMPEGWTDDGFCLNLQMAKSVLYATHFPSGRRAAFDAKTGKLLAKVPWPDAKSGVEWSKWSHSTGYGSSTDFYLVPGTDRIVAFDGKKVHQFAPHSPKLTPTIPPEKFAPPAELALAMRYQLSTDCRILVYDHLRRQVQDVLTIKQPEVKRSLFGLGLGPDGKLYGGAFQSTMLYSFDPKTGKSRVLGDHHPGWSGETYSFSVRKGELVCASYTNGAIVLYDPQKPWKCEKKRMINPRLAGFLGQLVYRPLRTVVDGEGKIWSVGPAGWGTTGGGVAYIDPDTKKTHSTALDDVPWDVVTIPENRLLVLSGAKVRWWDCKTDKVIGESPCPFTCAATIKSGLKERVFLGGGREVVEVQVDAPGELKIITSHQSPAAVGRMVSYKGLIVVGGADGFASLDPQTGAWDHFSNHPLEMTFGMVATERRVYFHSGTELKSVAIRKPVKVSVKAVSGGESAKTAGECRRMLIGPGFNQPDPFPGYDGFVGWEGPLRLKDGTLLMTFSAGYWHASPSTPLRLSKDVMDEWTRLGMRTDVDAPTGGRAMIIRSTDGGVTWSKPETLIDTPEDDRHPNCVELPDGTVLCTFFTYPGHGDFEKHPELAGHVQIVRSKDGGKTWEKTPKRLPSPFIGEATDGPAIVMKDGSVLLAVYGLEKMGVPEQVAFFRSTDSGETWKLLSVVKSDHEMSEPTVAQTQSGRLVMISRPEGEVCFSDDGGVSWSRPTSLGIRLYEPGLVALKDGTLLCLHGSYATGGVRAIFSTDEGETWTAPAADRGFAVDTSVYGYSKGIELPDGSVFIVYIGTGGHSTKDAQNEAIWAVRLKVRPDHSGIELLPAPGR